MCVTCSGQSLALHSYSGAHCHPRGSHGHGLAWLCWAQPAHWAELGTQVFHSGVMETPENWFQIMVLFLQTTGVIKTAVRTWQRPQVPAGSQGCSMAHTCELWGYQRPELQKSPACGFCPASPQWTLPSPEQASQTLKQLHS